jgi:prophage regulatory protein
MNTPPLPVLVRLPEVMKTTGLSSSSIYRAMVAGKFPRPIKIGDGLRAVSVWRADEIAEWVERLTAQRGDAYMAGAVQSEASAMAFKRGRPPKKPRVEETAA